MLLMTETYADFLLNLTRIKTKAYGITVIWRPEYALLHLWLKFEHLQTLRCQMSKVRHLSIHFKLFTISISSSWINPDNFSDPSRFWFPLPWPVRWSAWLRPPRERTSLWSSLWAETSTSLRLSKARLMRRKPLTMFRDQALDRELLWLN